MRQIFAFAALSLTLAACGEFRENASASIVEGVTGTALGPKPYAPADFVVRSRGADAPFMAVGVSAPERRVKPRTQAQAAALQSELAAAAQAQQAAGAATAAEGQRVSSNPPKPPKVE
ncbi:MAG: hypothetical protein BGP06_13510 [Rhizobiales bacterium 65-9]|nr:MAG: hypothetical protein BGP06_13510 [Rhizobiales bacterium 65-9]